MKRGKRTGKTPGSQKGRRENEKPLQKRSGLAECADPKPAASHGPQECYPAIIAG